MSICPRKEVPMKPNITTIPITELFTDTDGCPICRMHRMLEEQYVEYITGAAMMAPDVRVKTNRVGFCHRHFSMMVNNGPRLSNALLLQTHIDELRKKVFPKKNTDLPDKKMLVTVFIKGDHSISSPTVRFLSHLPGRNRTF